MNDVFLHLKASHCRQCRPLCSCFILIASIPRVLLWTAFFHSDRQHRWSERLGLRSSGRSPPALTNQSQFFNFMLVKRICDVYLIFKP